MGCGERKLSGLTSVDIYLICLGSHRRLRINISHLRTNVIYGSQRLLINMWARELVYTFIYNIRFVANPPYTIRFLFGLCLLAVYYFESSDITSRAFIPFYRPAACLEAHPAGVPGNCHLLASCQRHQETALDKVSKNLEQSYQRLHLVHQPGSVCHSLGPTAFA